MKPTKQEVYKIKNERVKVIFTSAQPQAQYETWVKRTNVPSTILKNLDNLFSGNHSNAELQEAFNQNHSADNFQYTVEDEITTVMLPLYFKQLFQKGGIDNE